MAVVDRLSADVVGLAGHVPAAPHRLKSAYTSRTRP
jgi:hypothetical protein